MLDGEPSGPLVTFELGDATGKGTGELPTYCGPLSLRTQPVFAVRAAGQETCLKLTLLEVRNYRQQRGIYRKAHDGLSAP